MESNMQAKATLLEDEISVESHFKALPPADSAYESGGAEVDCDE